MLYAELTPEGRMNELQKSLQQIHDYAGNEEGRGKALLVLRRRSHGHYEMMKQLEERGRLTQLELDRWQKIKSEYRLQLPEVSCESS